MRPEEKLSFQSEGGARVARREKIGPARNSGSATEGPELTASITGVDCITAGCWAG